MALARANHRQTATVSILLDLAVGDLEFLAIGDQIGVYAELTVLEKAAWELCDTERMIAAAKLLYGLFSWDRYDVIFLPSSFSSYSLLVALVAHELAHTR